MFIIEHFMFAIERDFFRLIYVLSNLKTYHIKRVTYSYFKASIVLATAAL